jgi:hypothetical protein
MPHSTRLEGNLFVPAFTFFVRSIPATNIMGVITPITNS